MTEALQAIVLCMPSAFLRMSDTCKSSSLFAATNNRFLDCRAAGGRCRCEFGMLTMMDGTYVVVDALESMDTAVVTPKYASFWLVTVVAETDTTQNLIVVCIE